MIQTLRYHKAVAVLFLILSFSVVALAGAEELTVEHSQPPRNSEPDPALEGAMVEFQTPADWVVDDVPSYILIRTQSQDVALFVLTDRIETLEDLPVRDDPTNWTAIELLEQVFILSGEDPPAELQDVMLSGHLSSARIDVAEAGISLFFLIPSPGILFTVQAVGINQSEETVMAILDSLRFIPPKA